MKSEIPKVLHSLNKKPLIQYVVDNLNSAGIHDIIVVVGYKGDEVIQSLGNQTDYVWQYEQLGTGHAVLQADEKLKDFSGKVLVACGDVPLIKPETFSHMLNESEEETTKAVVLTMELDDPTGYGRIVKDKNGSFKEIVEEKDADSEQKQIHEVNSGTYVFDKKFLFEGLKRINTDNAQGEYYLPDALAYIITSGFTVKTLLLEDPIEGSGINSKEELIELEKYLTTV